MNAVAHQHRSILKSIARQAMLDKGLLPDFSAEALAELEKLQAPAVVTNDRTRDLRQLLWASIDNDDSLDLDQLTVAASLDGGKVKVLVAIADVDSAVHDSSAIDAHARNNTTSVYTAAEIFPMLPEKISTDITSLNYNEDRLAIVVDIQVGEDGSIQESAIYRSWVRNHAKLAYNQVAAWLEGRSGIPAEISAVHGLAENLLLQNRIALSLKTLRHLNGALSLDTVEAKPVFDGDQISALETEEKNRAREVVEDFMIAANGVVARYLSDKNFPSIRRMVRTPKRWERIVEIAKDLRFTLPDLPNSKALEEFLVKQKAADPLRFPDLSLSVVKLLGAGEYIAELPGEKVEGHFGLAVKDYAHSTAPNRRYPDLLTQRLVKAALEGSPVPYSIDELDDLAAHCTQTEDAANKVERQVGKSAAALLLESRTGEQFDAIVTGASQKGTWVRLLTVPVEGRVVQGFEGMDVGEQVRVQLIAVDVEKGYIDFRKAGKSRR